MIIKKQNKELLLKDICERLPYDIKVLYNNKVYSIDYVSGIYEEIKLDNSNDNYTLNISNVKPYLFPLSSMTEHQKIECFKEAPLIIDEDGDIVVKEDDWGSSPYTTLEIYLKVIDWLNTHHFDYRGLIEKGLAIDATELNIY